MDSIDELLSHDEERRQDEWALKRVAEEDARLAQQKREALKERTRTVATSR